MLEQYARLTKKWDEALNAEWSIRTYFSSKMVLAASMMAQSLRYAEENNLRVVVSYLSYYSVLHSLRAIVFMAPSVPWNDGKILKLDHAKTINLSCDEIGKFNGELADTIKHEVLHLKAFRELISYRAPSSGDNFLKPNIDVYQYCRFFLEITQMQSELLEQSIGNNANELFDLPEEPSEEDYEKLYEKLYHFQTELIQRAANIEIEDFKFHDEEDEERLRYFVRKYPYPMNILHTMTEGHVENFFGSWSDEAGNENAFNPDEDWRILFDIL